MNAARPAGDPAPLLQTIGLTGFHGDAQALFGIDFALRAGELVAIIGANGAGKSTFLRAIVGQVKAPAQQVRYAGADIGGLAPGEIVRRGISLVPEGRRLFPSLSVEENLRIGAFAGRRGAWDLAGIYRLFPVLENKRRQPATNLSGGQQQMVAIGRALMSNPAVLLCDELSLGLAPLVIQEIYAAVPALIAGGTSLVIVEQDIALAMSVADRCYCFREGRVVLQGISRSLDREAITQAYFGIR